LRRNQTRHGQQATTQHSFVAHIDLRASGGTECSKPSSVHRRPGAERLLPC
jgi:hypothetical protein